MDFRNAVAEWRRLSISLDESDTDHLENVEIRILDHDPISIGQAARILDVVIAEPDGRSDQRDTKAIMRVRNLLAQLANLADEEPEDASAAAA